MSYYKICPDCGDNLDPGERCDCRRETLRSEALDLIMQLSDKQLEAVFESVATGNG